MTNFIQKTHLDIGFSDFNCLLDSQCSLLTSQILGSCIKLKWSNRAYAVYWLCVTLLYPCSFCFQNAPSKVCSPNYVLFPFSLFRNFRKDELPAQTGWISVSIFHHSIVLSGLIFIMFKPHS